MILRKTDSEVKMSFGKKLFWVAALALLSWNGASANEIRVVKNVVYGVGAIEIPVKASPDANPSSKSDTVKSEINLLLDVYEPVGLTGKLPAVLVIHGGGWFGGDKADAYNTEVSRSLAADGIVVFSVNYRLVPKARYPAQLDDVQRAVRWVRAHSDEYGIDAKRMGATGDSAGGHLASLLGTRDTRDNSDEKLSTFSSKVKCVVDLYGPSDFMADKSTSKLPSFASSLVTNFFGIKREDALELYREGSPISHVDKSSAAFLIMHGDKDPLVPADQSSRLADALKRAGVEVKMIVMLNDGHGFKRAENCAQQKSETLAFFKRLL